MNIAILGAGGIGFNLAPVLSRVLFHQKKADDQVAVTVIDGDEVEPKNTSRAYGAKDVGRNKAESLCHELTESFGEHISFSINRNYVSPDTLHRIHKEWFRDDVTIFGCVDNNKTRAFMDESLDSLNSFTYIDGGNSEWEGQAQLILKRKGKYLTPRLIEIAPEVQDEGDPKANVFPDDKSCTEEYESLPQLYLANASVAMSMANLWYSQVLVPEYCDGYDLVSVYKDSRPLNQVLVQVQTASAHQFSRESLTQ
jgi:molybdopterin/thiamine biosynthesis adenylyltransferase